MNPIQTLLIAAAAAPLLTACGSAPALFPEPEPWPIGYTPQSDYLYEPLTPQQNEAVCRALTTCERVMATREGVTIELKPAEVARLLATLRRVRQWYRVVERDGQRIQPDSRLIFLDHDGGQIELPHETLLNYTQGENIIDLAELAERYLPATAPCLPHERQIKVLGVTGKEVFVMDGESFASPSKLKHKARSDVSYELYFEHKRTDKGVRELLDKLGDGIRIEQINLPTSWPENNGRHISRPPR